VLDGAELVADVPADAAVVGELAYLPGGADPARCIALVERLAGRPRLWPPSGRRIVFDSVGTAVVDAAAVALVLAAAEGAGVGTLVDFAS
jgi:ornithine cyclodeaminase/alanine dehydrogenase-like protein (mu-crystallin family)